MRINVCETIWIDSNVISSTTFPCSHNQIFSFRWNMMRIQQPLHNIIRFWENKHMLSIPVSVLFYKWKVYNNASWKVFSSKLQMEDTSGWVPTAFHPVRRLKCFPCASPVLSRYFSLILFAVLPFHHIPNAILWIVRGE